MPGIIGTRTVTQIAMVVRDIEATKKAFAAFFEVEVPGHSEGSDPAIAKVVYRGNPAPTAIAKLAFFKIAEGVNLELIEPNGEPSVWQEHLDKHGDGLHHIGFAVEDLDGKVLACQEFGFDLVQRGFFGSGKGRYAYLDKGLPCYIELLEYFK